MSADIWAAAGAMPQWSDPFGSTVGPGGFINVAGFGDTTHATGPLGGGQIGAELANGAPGPWRRSRRRRCEHARREHVLLRPRRESTASMPSARSAPSPGASATPGTARSPMRRAAAPGPRQATICPATPCTLARHRWHNPRPMGMDGRWRHRIRPHQSWTALAEYDHVGVPSATVPFPSVAVINTQTIGVKQSVNLFKLGVNYKFELADLGAIAACN